MRLASHHCRELELCVELDESDVEGSGVGIVIFGVALLPLVDLEFHSLRMLVDLLGLGLTNRSKIKGKVKEYFGGNEGVGFGKNLKRSQRIKYN